MKKEYDLSKLTPRKKRLKNLEGTKVVRTIRLDSRLLAWLASEADRRGIPYQTLINSILTEAMNQRSGDLRQVVREVVREELKKAM